VGKYWQHCGLAIEHQWPTLSHDYALLSVASSIDAIAADKK
jgi:hypothetical protein